MMVSVSVKQTHFHFPSINRVPYSPLSPITIYHTLHFAKFQKTENKSCYQACLVKNKCSLNAQISPAKSPSTPDSSVVVTDGNPGVWQWYGQKLGFDLDDSSNSIETYIDEEKREKRKNIGLAYKGNPPCNKGTSSNSIGIFVDEDAKERERRKKIGLANKGNVPWNKGKKHTTETRERIKQRTKEAMMDPKVRKKMAECPRVHSEQTKKRIGNSLKRLWAKKLKWKRSRAKFLSIWSENIAVAAKRGGYDQQELEWNCYDNIKKEIDIQQLKWAANIAETRQKEKLAAVQRKIEKMTRLAQNREAKEQRAKALKLKERLTKIHKRKIPTNGQMSGEDQRTWEKLDLEFIKTERRERGISLADQIQAAKTKRVDLDKETSLYSPRRNQQNEI